MTSPTQPEVPPRCPHCKHLMACVNCIAEGEVTSNARLWRPAPSPKAPEVPLPEHIVCKSAPPHIWLQVDPDPDEPGTAVYPPDAGPGDVTWCDDQINPNDTLYVRADLATARTQAMSQAARDVLAERRRQVEIEGWTPEHDDEHGDFSMSIAAACYALNGRRTALEVQTVKLLDLWRWTGWAEHWFKPKDRRRDLIRAAALIVAEIERLDRAALANPGGKTV